MRSCAPGVSNSGFASLRAPRNDGWSYAVAALQQPFRRRPRLGGDLRAGQHAGDFLAAVVGGERVDAGGDALALVERVLGDQTDAGRRAPRPAAHGSPPSPAPCAASRASRAPMASATAPPTPVSISSNTKRGRRAAIGQHHLERQQEPRQLAAGGDLHQRSRPRARIGLHPELDAIEALRPRRAAIGLDLRR